MATPGRRWNKWMAIGCGGFAVLVLAAGAAGLFYVARLAASSTRGVHLLDQGWEESEAGHYAAAIPLFTAGLRENINRNQRANAYGNRGWAETKLDRDLDAIRDFNAALALNPDFPYAILDRGLAYHRQGNSSAAFADYNRTIQLDPNKVDAYRNRALIFADRGLWQKAIADMNEAIRCAPSDPRWFVRRGYFYLQAGQLEQAQASLESALRLNPKDVDAYWHLATVFRRHGEPERGIEVVSASLQLHPDSAALHLARGLIYLDAFAPEKAQWDFDEAIRLRPKYASAYANRGFVALLLGSPDVALGFEKRATELDPKVSFAHFVRGRALAVQHHYRDALTAFDRAIALDRGSIRAIVQRALTEGFAGDYKACHHDLQNAVLTFPGNYQPHLALAWFLASCPQSTYRDAKAALQEARVGVQLSRRDPFALDALAMSYAEAGDFAQARQTELEAIAQIPNETEREPMQDRLTLFQQGKPFRDLP